MTFNDIMNSPLLYGLVICAIIYILIFCMITLRKAYKHGLEIGLTKEKMMTAVTSSAIYSIIPSLSIVVGLFSLTAVLGVPWSWFRLSVVGAVTYELMAADMVATGAGYESIAALNAAGDPSVVGTVMFVMSICILGGIGGVLIFGKKVQSGMMKARAKNGEIGALLTSVLSLAIMEAFLPIQVSKSAVHLAVAASACVITFLHMVIIKKFHCTWLKNFIMADTLILGMISSLFWVKVLG